jgi:hypothetical protein
LKDKYSVKRKKLTFNMDTKKSLSLLLAERLFLKRIEARVKTKILLLLLLESIFYTTP